jgi:hypothetical protein
MRVEYGSRGAGPFLVSQRAFYLVVEGTPVLFPVIEFTLLVTVQILIVAFSVSGFAFVEDTL